MDAYRLFLQELLLNNNINKELTEDVIFDVETFENICDENDIDIMYNF